MCVQLFVLLIKPFEEQKLLILMKPIVLFSFIVCTLGLSQYHKNFLFLEYKFNSFSSYI